MEVLKAYHLIDKQLKQREEFKSKCDSCVPDEYIELDKFILDILDILFDHAVETIEDLKELCNEV